MGCYNVPHRNTSLWKESVESGTPTPLRDECRAQSGLAAPARDGGTPALSLRGCQASRLSGAEAASGSGPSSAGVCGDRAGAPDTGAGGSVLGAVRADRRVEPGPRHAAPGPGGPPFRAPGRCERPLLRGGRRARAPASPGAPAPGAHQGHQASTRMRAERSVRTGVRASSPPQGPCGDGDPVRGMWLKRPAKVRMLPGTKLGVCHPRLMIL